MASTDSVIAQSRSLNCSGTRLAYRSNCITWPSDKFTFRIASCKRLTSAGFNLAGD